MHLAERQSCSRMGFVGVRGGSGARAPKSEVHRAGVDHFPNMHKVKVWL